MRMSALGKGASESSAGSTGGNMSFERRCCLHGVERTMSQE